MTDPLSTPPPVKDDAGVEVESPDRVQVAVPIPITQSDRDGHIIVPEETTLDEPVSTTLLRDLKRVQKKMVTVVIPRANSEDSLSVLQDWDLWGPLILCMLLASTLSYSAPSEQMATVFAAVFVIVWCGAGVVTLNAYLLGGNISFFQSVCVLGYCLFPLNIASIIVLASPWKNVYFKLIITILCFIWSTRASVAFMSASVTTKRRALAVYPVFLFYLTMSWMIVVG